MSGATTELNLATAVDSDDNADYLTIGLANSLRTVDALFNNVTGHTHGGAHQGGPVSPAAGSLPGTAITDGTITNAKLGPDVARANLLVNGGMENWQRGTSAFSANNAYTADRWQITLVGSDTMTVQQDTVNPDLQSRYDASVTFTLGTGGGQSQLVQTLKFTDFAALSNAVVSFSARVRTSTANAVRLGVYNGSAWSYSSFHTGGGVYQTLTVSNVTLIAGSTYYASFFFALSCSAQLDNAMLVAGSQPANYAPMHPADDLARCLRYYELKQYPAGYSAALLQAFSTTGASGVLPFLVRKAITPTITFSAAGTFSLTAANFSSLACTALASNATTDAAGITPTVGSGLVAGNATILQATSGQTPTIAIEANP